jgi:hypothetical protein
MITLGLRRLFTICSQENCNGCCLQYCYKLLFKALKNNTDSANVTVAKDDTHALSNIHGSL